ncbi:MAG: polymer-forming cytoskeletal protein [Anaerolineaceae bacterium]|nr:MAG: polymer-forming cytoskeletal protein [Anaerolineaceae bacterium]
MNTKSLKISWIILIVTLFAVGCTTVSTSGDYKLESGQTVQGNLVITSGNALLEEGSLVTGDVLMTSGNLHADGKIRGDIVLTSGNVSLGPEAVVHGNIYGTSGNVDQAEGAEVRGQISTNQSTFRIGGGFFASLLGCICGLPLLLIGGLILLVALIRRGRNGSSQPTPAAQSPSPPDDSAQKLKQLKALLDQDLITEAEYEAKKAEILDGM